MTKRYSVEQVAEMLGRDLLTVRTAVETLHKQRALSAETFLFAKRAWRVTPSDVSKIQIYLDEQVTGSMRHHERKVRRVVKRQVIAPPQSDLQPDGENSE
ncbi:hypothetical protein [Sulfoacidibacillus thermotolerans]|uniref:Uncharacterized protein n=1 Tax=Sulfoacidibacillus thermotolerans TaxID=1765684 RepID=A0A2U3DAM2_SULT2|nr:hypothetical protein [Sulfoacidibacillus thermotolerans]PWI58340.1 hypothetical protein BM613_03735 [Sulfoacidibacillus thermotolerans]